VCRLALAQLKNPMAPPGPSALPGDLDSDVAGRQRGYRHCVECLELERQLGDDGLMAA
jgi:hypothetical protein